MLVLSRRLHQTIIISDPAMPDRTIEVTVIGVCDDQVRFGVRAPREVAVRRPDAPSDERTDARRSRRDGPA